MELLGSYNSQLTPAYYQQLLALLNAAISAGDLSAGSAFDKSTLLALEQQAQSFSELPTGNAGSRVTDDSFNYPFSLLLARLNAIQAEVNNFTRSLLPGQHIFFARAEEEEGTHQTGSFTLGTARRRRAWFSTGENRLIEREKKWAGELRLRLPESGREKGDDLGRSENLCRGRSGPENKVGPAPATTKSRGGEFTSGTGGGSNPPPSTMSY